MSSVTLKNKAFPVGASIGAYLLTQKAPYVNAAPTGSAVATATVAADGSVTFVGLIPKTRYTAYYTPGGSDFRYIDFTADEGGRSSIGQMGPNEEAVQDVRNRVWLPGQGVAENMDICIAKDNVAAPASGTLLIAGGMLLPKGKTISRIGFISGTTAAGTPTHQVFALYRRSSLAKLAAVTADDTSTAWAADTAKELVLATPYTPAEDESVYGVLLVTATTVPTLTGANMKSAAVSGLLTTSPKGATADASLAGTPASLPATLGALTAVAGCAYCWVR
jgi:hypothetical protein